MVQSVPSSQLLVRYNRRPIWADRPDARCLTRTRTGLTPVHCRHRTSTSFGTGTITPHRPSTGICSQQT
eukprot:scaffold543740_cov22-Prasinocladus_malaysianus.AAC.1